MDLKNRYLVAIALLAFLAVQGWLVHQNESRYRASEDITLVRADLLRSKSEIERLMNEITNLRAELAKNSQKGFPQNQDKEIVDQQAAALEKCENRIRQLLRDTLPEIPSIDIEPDVKQEEEYPIRNIEEEAKKLGYNGQFLPTLLNLPSTTPDVPTHAKLSCDTAWMTPRNIHDVLYYDIFSMNWETEIGFVSDKEVRNSVCKFEVDGETETTPVTVIPTSYLKAHLAHCELTPKAKSFLQRNYYLDFKLIDSSTSKSQDISVCIPEEKKFYYLANCCIYRNDDNIIDQWLQWQTNMGIEHFFLYDHKSTDLTNKVLEKYIKEGKVTYLNWRNNRPEPHDINTYHVAQDSAYLSCTNRFRDRARWIWTGDTDEFLYTPQEESVLPLLKKHESNNYMAGVRAIGYRMTDDPQNPLPLIPDPKKETMLVEPYHLNMTFPQKYQYRSTVFSTYKVFVKAKEALYSSIHEMAGGGSSIDLPPSDVYFLHFRHERYGRLDSPNDKVVHEPKPFERFGKKIVLRYPQDMV